MNIKHILITLSLCAGASVHAQNQQPPERSGKHRPPPPPVMVVLDANKDRIIDANEIANASNALKQLDINGDGQLTDEELCPPRPEGRPENREGFRPPGN